MNVPFHPQWDIFGVPEYLERYQFYLRNLAVGDYLVFPGGEIPVVLKCAACPASATLLCMQDGELTQGAMQ